LAKAGFPFKRNRLRCVRCVNENRKKRKRLGWQASQSWMPLLRPSIPIGWHLRLLREINHDWLLATQALSFLSVFVYATHATQAIAFE